RIRTSGLCVPNAALYQAKLHPETPMIVTAGIGQEIADSPNTDNDSANANLVFGERKEANPHEHTGACDVNRFIRQ
ncbi:MAG: hypothetical protein EBT36_04570, partial [Betaproteobacteria bacterium]|nr:hypothetical protein [Betaproteobacteria bacterium]